MLDKNTFLNLSFTFADNWDVMVDLFIYRDPEEEAEKPADKAIDFQEAAADVFISETVQPEWSAEGRSSDMCSCKYI